jgi:DNA-directed RNA polymerase subunit RPC12/RpoP
MNRTSMWSKKFFHKTEREHDSDHARLSYRCPGCGQVLTLKNEIVEPTIMSCPHCGQKGIMRPKQKQLTCINKNTSGHHITFADSPHEKQHFNIPAVEVKILGILLLILGVILHFVFNIVSLKISVVLIIIGIIIFTFIPSNRKIPLNLSNNTAKEKPLNETPTQTSAFTKFMDTFLLKQFDVAEKIALILILWIVFIYVLTGVNDIDIFFIFVYLGILLMKVFSTDYISSRLKQKINVFVIAFLVIFIIVIARRILTIVNL